MIIIRAVVFLIKRKDGTKYDYHFYRQDTNDNPRLDGIWSHKYGNGRVTNSYQSTNYRLLKILNKDVYIDDPEVDMPFVAESMDNDF